jgi:psp operon transcriptional activator
MGAEIGWDDWPGFGPHALDILESYDWPGNVRELRNVVERAVYRHEDPERPIDAINFDPFHSPWAPTSGRAPVPATAEPAAAEEGHEPAAAAPAPAVPASTSDFRAAVADYERQLLEEALRRNRFNQRATAAALNLSYDQLRHALKRHKLQDSAG